MTDREPPISRMGRRYNRWRNDPDRLPWWFITFLAAALGFMLFGLVIP